MKQIKQQFLAYRNGIIADTLRKAGWPHKVIFGLNLPQITEIARSLEAPDLELALSLWSDKEVRESRLLAPFLMPEEIPTSEVKSICSDLRTREEADILAFRWLRRHPQAASLADDFATSEIPLLQYLSTAIHRFIDD